MAGPGQCRNVQHCVNRGLNVRADTREIGDVEIFLTSAEELNFGRTAERGEQDVHVTKGPSSALTEKAWSSPSGLADRVRWITTTTTNAA
ncbi:hypothetical protein [Nonomuraea sp. NPDC049141]|uniref:hypothetical protein n=1 Tax=Nonomuraea sp. NPDC049141 TaxID=3155500 RepID=UPI0033C53A4C